MSFKVNERVNCPHCDEIQHVESQINGLEIGGKKLFNIETKCIYCHAKFQAKFVLAVTVNVFESGTLALSDKQASHIRLVSSP